MRCNAVVYAAMEAMDKMIEQLWYAVGLSQMHKLKVRTFRDVSDRCGPGLLTAGSGMQACTPERTPGGCAQEVPVHFWWGADLAKSGTSPANISTQTAHTSDGVVKLSSNVTTVPASLRGFLC